MELLKDEVGEITMFLKKSDSKSGQLYGSVNSARLYLKLTTEEKENKLNSIKQHSKAKKNNKIKLFG